MDQLFRPLTFLLVVGIVLFGAHLRMQSAIHTVIDSPIRADARDYFAYANNLKHHRTYSRAWPSGLPDRGPAPDAVRAPGYALFLSTLLSDGITLDAQLLQIYLVQALLSTLVIVLVFISARVMMGNAAALACAALTGVSPHLVVANSYVLTESLFCALLVIVMAAVTRFARKPDRLGGLVLGMLLGAAALTRPWLQYFVIVFCLWWLLARARDQPFAPVFMTFVGFILTFGPWLVRNLMTLGVTSDSTPIIGSLYQGMFPGFMYEGDPATFGRAYRVDPRSEEITTSVGTVLAEIWRHFQRDPRTYLSWYAIGKPLALLSWETVQGVWEIFIYPPIKSPYFYDRLFIVTLVAMRFVHAPLMLLAGIGACAAWIPRVQLLIGDFHHTVLRVLSLLFFYFIAVHTITLSLPRYAIPMRPMCYTLAVSAIFVLYKFAVQRLARARH